MAGTGRGWGGGRLYASSRERSLARAHRCLWPSPHCSAPPDCQVRHAASSLAVAAALRGPGQPPMAPGALHLPPVPTPSLTSLLAGVLAEGCIEETVRCLNLLPLY